MQQQSPAKKFLDQATCRNQACRVALLPVRYMIQEGEIQVKCRACKTVTVLKYVSGSIVYATVIAAP